LELHPAIRVSTFALGTERAPLLVIDNLVADAESLVQTAASKAFTSNGRFYPGIRAPAPLPYLKLVESRFRNLLRDVFQLKGQTLRFSLCHFSLVTTPADELGPLQRIPHVDSLDGSGLAAIHYLFKQDLGGTSFYRHRATGYETLDEWRWTAYSHALEREQAGPDAPGAQYINGNTALFEEISRNDGLFNRMLVYRRNSLHSGCIARDFAPDPSPLTGRLSINSFIDLI